MTTIDTTQRAAVSAAGISKVYGAGGATAPPSSPDTVRALDDVSVAFHAERFTAIMGPSGSGKSTLMHCMAGLDTVTSGSVRLGDTEITGLSDRQLTVARRERVGFVFQSFNLLPTLTAAQNLRLPLDIAGRRPDRAWWDRVVEMLGLRDRLDHRPSELSGGQQQRVAVGRALITRPEVVFADEPTGNLDSRSSAELLSFLRASVRELGQTIVMVTHDAVSASYADRVVFLRDGRLVDELTEPTPESVLDELKKLEV